jgi:hypothetical protein
VRNFYSLAIATVVALSSFSSTTVKAEPNVASFEYYRAPGTRADSWYPGYVDGYWVNYPYRPGFSNYRGSQFRYGGPYRYGYTSPYYGGDAGLRAKRDLEAEAARDAKAADLKK